MQGYRRGSGRIVRFALCLSLGLVALACEEKKEPTGSAAEEKKAPPPPYTGELTYERFEQVNAQVNPYQKWDETYAEVLGILGEPHEVEGKDHRWFLMHGEMCAHFEMENADGEVGVVGIIEYSDMMKEKYAKCAPAAGDAPAEPAPGEPAPGEPTEPAEAAPAE